MKQVTYTRYGKPEVLHIEEQARPQPAAGEILIQVQASTVTATDSIFRQGQILSARLFTGMRKPSRPTLGSEFSGEVVTLGAGVTGFQLGDRVLGPTAEGFGAHSEYLVLKEDAVLAHIPSQLNLLEAAALSAGGVDRFAFSARRGPASGRTKNHDSGGIGLSGFFCGANCAAFGRSGDGRVQQRQSRLGARPGGR